MLHRLGSSRVDLDLLLLHRDSVRHILSLPVQIEANSTSSGPTLEEIARIFDGDNAEVADIDIDGKGLSNRNDSIKEPHVQIEKA